MLFFSMQKTLRFFTTFTLPDKFGNPDNFDQVQEKVVGVVWDSPHMCSQVTVIGVNLPYNHSGETTWSRLC